MKKTIIVAGGGHGGIAVAALLAKRGYDVTVYEKNSRENMGYDWTDIFNRKGLKVCGISIPNESNIPLKNMMTFYPPSGSPTLKEDTPVEKREIQMERKEIYNLLIDNALSAGVKFCFEEEIIAPIVYGNRVVGIETQNGKHFGDLVIDACGVNSPVRSKLPKHLGIQNKTKSYDKFYVYRAFYERTGEIPDNNFNVLLFRNNKLGISWVAIEEEHTDVLIGRFNPTPIEDIEEEIASLREIYPELGEKRVRGGQFVQIPVRAPLSKLVCDGYAAIGDSAFMTISIMGSGIATALQAAPMLANAIINDKNGEYTTATLWKYQKDFFTKIGTGLAVVSCAKMLATKLKMEEVDSLFRLVALDEGESKISTDLKDIRALLQQNTPAVLAKKAKALIKDKELLKKVLWLIGKVTASGTICAVMPRYYDKKAVDLWVKKYDDIFNLNK